MLTNKEISNIQITWRTFSFTEIKSRLQELYHSDMSFLDLVSALYWDLIETKHKYYHENVKFGNNRATLEEIAELKDELSGWQDNPFSIIAEVCGAVTDCRRCQWYEKCPFPKNYGSYPEEWRAENG